MNSHISSSFNLIHLADLFIGGAMLESPWPSSPFFALQATCTLHKAHIGLLACDDSLGTSPLLALCEFKPTLTFENFHYMINQVFI